MAVQYYKHGPISVLPYCGCEPLECHLLPEPTPIKDMRIDQVRPLFLKYTDATWV